MATQGRTRWMTAALAAGMAAAWALPAAHAQSVSTGSGQAYPQRPVRVVVGFSAGGPADILARVVGQHLTAHWGQQVVVDNRAGAGGNIAGETVAKSNNDGYTLYMANIGHAVNPALYRKLPFDPIRDFTPITLVATQPSLLVANVNFQAKSVSELIALAKAHPGTINFATAGNGTGSHLSGELFKMLAGIELTHVPYKGSPPATSDLLGGHVPLMIDGLPSALPLAQAGKVRALGITTGKRSPAAPDIPTIAEQGVPGYDSYGWNGLLGPAGINKALVERINRDVAAFVDSADGKERLAKLGYVPSSGSPDAFRAFIVAEKTKWAKVIERAGVHLD